MGTILASTIIAELQEEVEDTNTQWLEARWLVALNDAQKCIVNIKPDANVNNESVILVAGTKQTIPTNGTQLISISRNMGTGGSTAGAAILQTSIDVMDALVSDWHSATASAVVDDYMFDDRDPTRFYVSPPQPASNFGYVDIVYSIPPTDIASTSTAISLTDNYRTAYKLYAKYSAYSKDADYTANPQRATDYYQQFLRELGVREQNETKDSPNA